jgi:hypothetical protein
LYLSEAKLKYYLSPQVNIPVKPRIIFDAVKIQSDARKIKFCLAHELLQQYGPFVSAMKEVKNTEKRELGKYATYLRR